jgi:hypothetical protein
MGAGAAAAGAAQAAIAQAIKASGTLVRVEPHDFMAVLRRMESPLVIVAEGGVFRKHLRYTTSYRGFVFLTKVPEQLELPRHCETILAREIWIPD